MSGVIRETLTRGDQSVEILIEADEADKHKSPSSHQEDVARRQDYRGLRAHNIPDQRKPFSKGMELIRACAEEVADTLDAVKDAARPDSVEVEMGIKFDNEAGALIAKTSLGASLKVTLKWTAKDKA